MDARFPQPLGERFPAGMAQILARLKALEAKTMVLETGCFVVAYVGTIPGTYTSGNPTVELATGVVLGPLQYVSTYTPTASATVLVVPAGQSYIVVGALV